MAKKFKSLKLPPMPSYQPYDLNKIYAQSVAWDQSGYKLSDEDFLKRHPELVQGEKLFETQTLQDIEGERELMPAIQSEFMRAGLGRSLSAFGGIGPTLKPGGAGEASVARNLGLSIASFQDRNRQNRLQALTTAEQIFPRRQFGLTGESAAMLNMLNTQGVNEWNQANYANTVQNKQFNFRLKYEQMAAAQQAANANAQAQSQAGAGRQSAYIAAGTAVALAAAVAL